MTDQTLLLGIDVSTTGAKALLINREGTVVSSATTPLELSAPGRCGRNKTLKSGGKGW